MQCSAVQCSAVQCKAVCSTVQYSTVQYSTVQYSTVQYSTVQYPVVVDHTIEEKPFHSGSTASGPSTRYLCHAVSFCGILLSATPVVWCGMVSYGTVRSGAVR